MGWVDARSHVAAMAYDHAGRDWTERYSICLAMCAALAPMGPMNYSVSVGVHSASKQPTAALRNTFEMIENINAWSTHEPVPACNSDLGRGCICRPSLLIVSG